MKRYFYTNRHHGPRSNLDNLLMGVGTISIEQSMRMSRAQVASGSLSNDWKAVRNDIAFAIEELSREREAA